MRREVCRILHVVLCGLVVMAIAPAAHAQFKASVEGTVRDASGDAVKGASITVTNTETNQSETVTSSDSGAYRVPNLPPGIYTVSAEASGFKKSVAESIQVEAETPQRVDLTLEVGAVSESVTITDESVALQTENANVGGNISNIQVQRLPQVGRDPYELVRLAPGVFGDGARSGTQNATMLSLVSSGVGICTSSMRPLPHAPCGSTQALGRIS